MSLKLKINDSFENHSIGGILNGVNINEFEESDRNIQRQQNDQKYREYFAETFDNNSIKEFGENGILKSIYFKSSFSAYRFTFTTINLIKNEIYNLEKFLAFNNNRGKMHLNIKECLRRLSEYLILLACLSDYWQEQENLDQTFRDFIISEISNQILEIEYISSQYS